MEIKRSIYPNCSEWNEDIGTYSDKDDYYLIEEELAEDTSLEKRLKEWD
jgi:hypothetical protein